MMVSACLAALAFTACQQPDEVITPTSKMKSIDVSLNNAVISRGDAGTKIEAGKAINVNSLKIFLLGNDGTEYTAKTSDGKSEAQSWWASTDLSNKTFEASFHYVDNGCTKIVAVANIDSDLSYSDFLQMNSLSVDNEQDATNLTLYAESELIAKGHDTDTNEDGTTYLTDLFQADLTLYPRISRFEVDGFSIKFQNPALFQSIKITDILFQNYHSTCALATGVEGSEITNFVDVDNQAEVFNYFNGTNDGSKWYWDSFSVELSPSTPSGKTATPLAYHIFAGSTIPKMVIKMLADDQPAYIHSRGFYSATESENGQPKAITSFAEGKIYRMSTVGDDGLIPIKEETINPMERCIDISVTVEDWVVELVYPEF